jgi:adenosine deaminase CECR1
MALSHIKNLPWTTQMADNEWAEVEQGVPAKDEPFINKYLSGREALIDQEKKQRSGKQISIPT